jgi:hypothetical protein
VRCFRNIPKLILQYCPNVVDVSALEKVSVLSLSSYHGITDVSSLGKVYNLNLRNCDKIRLGMKFVWAILKAMIHNVGCLLKVAY